MSDCVIDLYPTSEELPKECRCKTDAELAEELMTLSQGELIELNQYAEALCAVSIHGTDYGAVRRKLEQILRRRDRNTERGEVCTAQYDSNKLLRLWITLHPEYLYWQTKEQWKYKDNRPWAINVTKVKCLFGEKYGTEIDLPEEWRTIEDMECEVKQSGLKAVSDIETKVELTREQ
ncbi:MAG: hypothetical protein LUE27_06870 [Clostridia bacterium]|nr:hypothetical protein [Clostridia bacterium]